MTDSNYRSAWGDRYEGHRVLLSRDYWMSVGFVHSDFENRKTWEKALRRGPVNASFSSKTAEMGTQTEDVTSTVPTETICIESEEEDSVSLTDLFASVKEPLGIDTSGEFTLGGYMDIGTPTLTGVKYDESDFDIDLSTDEIFEEEPVTIEIDMDRMGVKGMNLGEFVSTSSVGSFYFRPLHPGVIP